MKTTLIVIFTSLLFSGETVTENKDPLRDTLKRYREADSIRMELKKTVKLSLLNQEKTSNGTAYLSKGKLRLETKAPDESLIIMNDEAVWIVTPPVPGLSENFQVTKIISDKTADRARAPLAMILSDDSALELFKKKSEKKTKNEVHVTLKPLSPKDFPDVQKLSLHIKKGSNEIVKVAYQDELGNETSFIFNKIEFNKKLKKGHFDYRPPQNADVTAYR